MLHKTRWLPGLAVAASVQFIVPAWSGEDGNVTGDAAVVKALVRAEHPGQNALKPENWEPLEQGLQRQGNEFVCDNGTDSAGRRGASQRVILNQEKARPIVASAWSKAVAVSGTADVDFSIWIDLTFNDGTKKWGQSASFNTGTHNWQQARVAIFPDRPIKVLTFNLLLRDHAGKASFRDPELREVSAPKGGVVFDGVPVVAHGVAVEGFQVRDVAAGGDFVRIESKASALGLRLEAGKTVQAGCTWFDATLRDTTGKDRAITLVYAIPVAAAGLRWLDGPRQSFAVEPGREYVHATSFHAGSSGRLSSYPLGAVAGDGRQSGLALGIDMAHPAFFRIGYHAGTGELWIAYDLGLTPEKPVATVRFCRFDFASSWGFRAALAEYYRLFPQAFHRRVADQGLWMPFARISRVPGWEDFGFRFKEGNDETAWDDEHGILTFHYTEPLTWWMPMPKGMPRTIEAALGEAKRLAEQGKRPALALLSSGYENSLGQYAARFIEAPWNHGAVWSMNSMPGINGEATDFKSKWSPRLKDRLYGPGRKGELDGEYIDSSEGYVTDVLDFRRDHFAAAGTPLVFSQDTHRPAIFRGLIAYEYVRGISVDSHGMGKLMMANATPDRLCWLAPWLDVMGTETDWNGQGKWQPMSDDELLYRRALCKGKPYCFLMNTEFDNFPQALVEKYFKRSLAYGIFPGFFSHNAAEGHYFTRPALYDRDRPLFRKYLPLCKRVAQAGWEPITLARLSDEQVHLERFGDGPARYLTVFNDSSRRRTATITLEHNAPATSRELVSGQEVAWNHRSLTLSLDGEDLAILELHP
jgi:hypothetical protein